MYCYYDSHDLDGRCSAATVLRRYPDVKLIPLYYQDNYTKKIWDMNFDKDTIFFVDVSTSPLSHMINLQNQGNDVIWLDHHKTAIDEASERGFQPLGYQRNGTAACVLTWMYLFRDIKIPSGVELLGRWDIWDHDDNVKKFQYGMKALDTEPHSKTWHYILNDDKSYVDFVLERGKFVKSFFDREEDRIARGNAFEISFMGYRALAINRQGGSLIVKSLFDPEKQDIVVCFTMNKNHEWVVSLYSDKEDIDVGKLAKRFGGGGHKGAAGFRCAEFPFNLGEN